jgi:Outer membrane lipoprotein-sorting protein
MSFRLFAFFLPFFFVAHALAADPSAEEILKKADRARGGMSEGLQWKIHLESSGGAQPSDYDVQVKGVNAIARCFAPARQKGETLLFNDRNLWIHKPGLKKPVSLSPRQRLTGQAANGDIASTNYARDYTGTIEGKDTVDGKPAWRLFLQAKEKNVTYDKIRYWVSQGEFLGVKAEFLTLEGKTFKRAHFEYKNSVQVGGKPTPFVSRMDIEDANIASEKTSIVYTAPVESPLADSLFNVNNLAR